MSELTVTDDVSVVEIVDEEPTLTITEYPLEIGVNEQVSVLELAEAPTLIEIVSETSQGPQGVQGPPGPIGPPSDIPSVRFHRMAGEPVSGHRVVRPEPDGTVKYASNMDPRDVNGPWWLTLNAAGSGDDVELLAVGVGTEGSWNWEPGKTMFLRDQGVLSQVPQEDGYYLVRLATAITATSVFMDPAQPLILAPGVGTYGGYGMGYYGEPPAGGYPGGYGGGYSGSPEPGGYGGGYGGGYSGSEPTGGYDGGYEGGY